MTAMPRTESPAKDIFSQMCVAVELVLFGLFLQPVLILSSGCSRQSRQAKCEWGQRQAFNLGGPEIAFVGQVSGSERSGADHLAGT